MFRCKFLILRNVPKTFFALNIKPFATEQVIPVCYSFNFFEYAFEHVICSNCLEFALKINATAESLQNISYFHLVTLVIQIVVQPV